MKKGLYIFFNLRQFLTLSLVFILAFSLTLAYRFASTTTSSTVINTDRTIIVDAGHGGEDGGTQSSTGVLEKDINLAISFKVGTILRLMGYTVVYTRSEDKLQYGADALKQRQKKVSDIHYRMNLMENYPDAVFLSIHQNYFTQSKYYGAQVFYSKNNPLSKTIAESIQGNIHKLLQNDNDRQIKPSGTDVYLLYHAKNPAVMVECGFMSNPGEALLLSDGEYQKKMALAIVAGIEEYC
jgi:N-acetylmuramoyl-L-alanine amidase